MSLGSRYATGCHPRVVAQRPALLLPSCRGGRTSSSFQMLDTSFLAHPRSCTDFVSQATVCVTSDCNSCIKRQRTRLHSCNGAAQDCPGLTPGRMKDSRTSSITCISFGHQCKGVSVWRRHRRHTFRVSGSHGGAEIGPSQEPRETERRQESGVTNFAGRPAARFSKVKWVRSLLKQPKLEGWTVPWGFGTVVFVMLAWFVSYWSVGSWGIPMAAEFMGYNLGALGLRGQAFYSLITDFIHSLLVWILLARTLSVFQPLPKHWFPLSWKGPGYGEAILACASFPVVVFLSELNVRLIPGPVLSTMLEKSLGARDPVAMILYAIVVSVFAPVWEEFLFRGFLLPSLTRYIPPWGSIGVSALTFAIVHGQSQRMFPLFFLGVIIGIVFIRSKNLLAAILLHSLWNLFVFVTLFIS